VRSFFRVGAHAVTLVEVPLGVSLLVPSDWDWFSSSLGKVVWEGLWSSKPRSCLWGNGELP
jgi:hypothetical protein